MITLAIVEDHLPIQELLQATLDTEPDYACVGVFSTGREAVAAIPDLLPDVVLMDIGLPDVNGIECVRQLKPLCPGTEFVMCTIYDEDEKVWQALEYGASSYILKRSKPEFLISAIREVHAGGSPMSADIARKIVRRFQHHPERENVYGVTAREREILEGLSKGLLYKEVAEALGISINTLKRHIYNLYEKLHVDNKVEAINKMFGEGRRG